MSNERTILPTEDADRVEFLQCLDAAPFDVTDWEAQFIEDHISHPRAMTPRQREAVDQMRNKYESRL